MTENSLMRLWFMRAMFVLLSGAVIFVHLIPLQTTPARWPTPDLLLVLGFAWALRRGEFVPPALFALVMLFGDLIFDRPPGLYAALSLIALEMLKARAGKLRDMPFTVEWASAGMAIIAVILLYRLILATLVIEQFAFGLALGQTVLTILCYPVVIGFSYVFFRLTKPVLGEVNALGQRL